MTEETYISSRANPLVRKYAALTDKKNRESERLFLLNGVKLVSEAAANRVPLEALLLCEGKESDPVTALLSEMEKIPDYRGTCRVLLSESAFGKISDEKSPDGVIAVAKYLDNFQKSNTIEKSRLYSDEKIMLLCSVRDPGNLGTIVRSAAAFGFDRLIVSADTADIYNIRTMRASMGAFFRIRVDAITDFADAVGKLRAAGRRVFCAELRPGAHSVDAVGLTGKDCVIIGNEGHGIPEEISSLSDGSVYIPIVPGTESLNAAIAASVIAYMQR